MHDHDNDHHEHDNGVQEPQDGTPTPPPFTVDEVLANARNVERTAAICLRADLQAEWDLILSELSFLFTPTGELLGDDGEASLADQGPRARAEKFLTRAKTVQTQMRDSMWYPRFRGMDSAEFVAFKKRFAPKGEKADWSDFYNRLIAETAVAPTITREEVVSLRSKLGVKQIEKLINTASEACIDGGLDVPKSPHLLRTLEERLSEG
jgi:hypothetical protein